jgi:Lrp/AsnC family transcriptional regulator, leucine-responsive regulatory protein
MKKTLKQKEIDSLDHKILAELQKNARIANAEIGRRVGLSAPAVGDRITKLEEHGYIEGYRTILNMEKVGLTIQALISFKAESMRHKEMLKMVEAIPEVAEWYAVTGSYCMMVKVIVANSRQLESVIVKLSQHGDTSTALILSGSSSSKMVAISR